MGTSKSSDGPTGSNPLLPPWAPDLDPEPEPDNAEEGDPDEGGDGEDDATSPDAPPPRFTDPPAWRGLFGQTKRLASSGATGGSARTHARSIARKYVSTRGGARQAAQGSVAGRSTGPRIGRFLSDVAQYGVDQALRNLRLDDYIGGSADDLLTGLAERLLPPPNSPDEAAANKAGLEAFYDLLQQYDALDGGLDALDALDADGIQHALEHFIARYIAADLLSRLSQRVEDGSSTFERCDEILGEIRSVIIETVRLDLKGRDVLAIDWNGPEGRQFIDRQLLNAYSLLEEE